MYLFHVTDIHSLKKILIDNALKSASITGNINEGSSIYDHIDQDFVFFSVTDEIHNERQIYGDVILFFDYELLYNRSYYVSTIHSSTPDKLSKWNDGKHKHYKLKYNQYHKYTKKVLEKLYNNSISMLPKGSSFQIFQQVAIKNKCNLDKLVYIKFQKQVPTALIKTIKDKHPDIGFCISSK